MRAAAHENQVRRPSRAHAGHTQGFGCGRLRHRARHELRKCTRVARPCNDDGLDRRIDTGEPPGAGRHKPANPRRRSRQQDILCIAARLGADLEEERRAGECREYAVARDVSRAQRAHPIARPAARRVECQLPPQPGRQARGRRFKDDQP